MSERDEETQEVVALTNPREEFEIESQVCSVPTNVAAARRLLYVSHLFAQFSEVSWQFSVALFLAACTNYQSLALVSTYGISLGLAVCVCGPRLGRWIDTSDRLLVARWLILFENIAVLLGTVCCYTLLSKDFSHTVDDDDDSKSWLAHRLAHVPTGAVAIISLVGIHLFGATAQILDQSFLVAIERDWVVVLAQAAASQEETNGHIFKQWLSKTNVAMKQIDLNCKIAAPGIAGLAISQLSTGSNATASELQWACLFVGGLNVLALVVEYVCTAKIYQMVPGLSSKHPDSVLSNDSNVDNDESELEEISPKIQHTSQRCCCSFLRLPDELELYRQQPICWGGLGLSMLYMNALTFGNGILTAYLLYRNVKLELVGFLRGVASAIGLLGTVVYHYSAKHFTLETTGMWSVAYQFVCLMVAFTSLFMGRDNAGLALLIAGVCLSRIGLWVHDIAITQMQQQEIPEHARGTVGGVQQALNAFFTLVSFTLGLVFPNPRDFLFLVMAACTSVGCSMILFACGVYWPRIVSSSGSRSFRDHVGS